MWSLIIIQGLIIASFGLGVPVSALLGGIVGGLTAWLTADWWRRGVPVFRLFDGALVPDVSMVVDNGQASKHDLNRSALMWDYERTLAGLNSLVMVSWTEWACAATIQSSRSALPEAGRTASVDALLWEIRSKFVELYGREPIIAWVRR